MYPDGQAPQPAAQPAEPTQTPDFSIDNLIIDNPALQPEGQEQPASQAQPEAQPEAQPTQQPTAQPEAQPEVQPPVVDPYASTGGVRNARLEFERYLDEKFPIRGKLDINSIDKKDPDAFSRFMDDMQEATRSDAQNQQLRESAKAEFERQIFEPVYQAYPNLRQDPTTDGLVRMLYKGAAADNPDISPVRVATAFSNFARNLYNAAVKSAQANIKTIPAAPAGSQGRAATKILNNEVVEKMASGSVDDVAKLVAGLQGRGVGGL